MWQKRIGKKIDQLLIEAKLITKKQLANALERQKENGQSLGKNLVDLGYINEDEIDSFLITNATSIHSFLVNHVTCELEQQKILYPLHVNGNRWGF